MVDKPGLLGAHWWMLLLTLILFGLVAAFVDSRDVGDDREPDSGAALHARRDRLAQGADGCDLGRSSAALN